MQRWALASARFAWRRAARPPARQPAEALTLAAAVPVPFPPRQMIIDMQEVMALERDAPDREAKIKAAKKEGVDWVAKYRRQPEFAGRPSYGNTYGAINAVAGHYNSFGYAAPISKKRSARIVQELGDAERALKRGR